MAVRHKLLSQPALIHQGLGLRQRGWLALLLRTVVAAGNFQVVRRAPEKLDVLNYHLKAALFCRPDFAIGPFESAFNEAGGSLVEVLAC